MEDEILLRSSSLFSALGSPVRLKIVQELAGEPLMVTVLASKLGIGQPNASQHLAVLERAGLIQAKASGTSRVYSLRGPRVAQLLATMAEFCEVHGLRGVPDEGSNG
jgi:DNA-binding transcriptional ArsR family regulator